MGKIAGMAVCLLGIFLLSTCSESKVEMLGSIYGNMTQAIGGEPVAGATVTLNPGGKSLTTGGEGRYEFTGLEPGEYTIQVWANDYKTERKVVTVEPGVRVNADMMLRSGSGTIRIVNNYLDFGIGDNVRVFDVKNTGKAPLYFEVLENEEWLKVTPQRDTIQPEQSCPVTVTIDRSRLSGNKIYTLAVASDAGSEEVVVKVTVEEVGDLHGTVSDALTNEPLHGVNVTLVPLGRAMTTGSDGRYEFSRLAVGQYTLQITKDKYQTDNRTVTVKIGEAITLDVVLKGGKGNLQVVKNYLDFGTDSKILVFDLKNIGLTGLTFEIRGVEEWVKVEPVSGTIASGESQPVAVTLDRTLIRESKNCRLTVTSDVGSEEVVLRVVNTSGGGGEGSGDVSVISSGLVAFYCFDEANCNDATLNAYNGSAMFQPLFVTDSPNGKGNSLLLNAPKQQYVNIPYNPLFDKYDYTLSFWIRDFSDGLLLGAINTEDYGTSRSSFPRIICQNGQFVFYNNYGSIDETPPFNYDANAIKSDGKWHMLTFTCMKKDKYDTPFERKLYVDGALMASSNLKGWKFVYNQGISSEFHIGGNGGKKDMSATTMKIDNIRMYDRCLDRNEAELLYEADR